MRTSLLAAVVAAASLTVASCAMPADDPNWNASAAAGDVFEEDQAGQASAEADALAGADAALAAPTSIGVDTPLASAPAAGQLIVSVLDGSESDTIMSASMAEAAKAIGWDYQEVTGADPVDLATTAPAAFDEALALNPAGIRISGAYVDYITDGLAAAESAGIPVVCTGCAGEPTGAIKDTGLDGDAQNTEWAKVLAAYVFANKAPNENATVELFSLPVPALNTFTIEFIGGLADLCRECSVLEEPIDPTTGTDAATFVSDTMSISLGRWALLSSGNVSAGVSDALATAELFEPAIIIGRGPSAGDIAALQAIPPVALPSAGAEASPQASASADAGEGDAAFATPEQAAALQAWTAVPIPVLGWRVIDQFARILGGDSLADGPLPSQLLTVANAKDAVLDADGNYIGIADYQDQFAALWGVK